MNDVTAVVAVSWKNIAVAADIGHIEQRGWKSGWLFQRSYYYVHIACWHIVYACWHTASTHLHFVCTYVMLACCACMLVCCACMMIYCVCMHGSILCMHVGILSTHSDIGHVHAVLTWWQVHEHWHFVHACWHGLSSECYRHVRNVVHIKFDTNHATPIGGELTHLSCWHTTHAFLCMWVFCVHSAQYWWQLYMC